MKTETYAAFSRSMQRQLESKGRMPLNGTIELTRRCPLECQHCYNNLPVGDREALQNELSFEEIQKLMDDMADAGCLWLLLTGGEVFARKDALQIYDYAKSKGFLITLFTNAIMITEAIADHLAHNPPFSIEVTLYGRTKETYEKLTQIPGSYGRCMRGIQLLMERKLPLKLKTVATTITKDEIWAMRDFAEGELGVEFKFDGLINPRIDCSQSPLHVRLQPEDLVRLDLQDERRVEEWRKLAENSHARTNPPSEQVYTCGGGINSFSVDPTGGMSICVLSHQEHFNVREGGFDEGWNGFLKETRAKKRTRLTKCVSCQIKDLCGMCAANGELHGDGDPEKPVEFLCQTAHLRAFTFGIQVAEHGECEYCHGGHRHVETLEKAKSLLQEQVQVIPRKTKKFLRVVPSGEQAAGCGGCA